MPCGSPQELGWISEPLHLTVDWKIFTKKCLVKVYFQRSQSNIVSGYPLTFLPQFWGLQRVNSLFTSRYWYLSLDKMKDPHSHPFIAYPSALDIRQQSAWATAPAAMLEQQTQSSETLHTLNGLPASTSFKSSYHTASCNPQTMR